MFRASGPVLEPGAGCVGGGFLGRWLVEPLEVMLLGLVRAACGAAASAIFSTSPPRRFGFASLVGASLVSAVVAPLGSRRARLAWRHRPASQPPVQRRIDIERGDEADEVDQDQRSHERWGGGHRGHTGHGRRGSFRGWRGSGAGPPVVAVGVAATVGSGVEELDGEPVPVAGAVVTLNPPMR